MPPPIPACAADLKAELEKQLTLLAARSGIRLRLPSNLDEAAVVIAIGDTLHEYGINGWMRGKERTSQHLRIAAISGFPVFHRRISSKGNSRDPMIVRSLEFCGSIGT